MFALLWSWLRTILFYVNLMKEDVLTDYDIIVLIDNLQLLLYEKIVVDGNKECCEEITENIFISHLIG